MTSIVIPFLYSKKSDGAELRFCLRSIEKHLKNYGEIFLIGEPPLWLKDCKIMSVKDSPYPRQKENNIYRKIIAACENPEITDDFIFFNDDHGLLKTYQADKFPYYWHRTLMEAMQKNNNTYRATLNHSRQILEERGLPTKDFDCHCPIIYNKKKFIKTFKGLQWPDWGFAIKSLYANINGIAGIKTTDLKITKGRLKEIQLQAHGRDWFSTGTCNKEVEIFLAGTYPKKSKYEY